MEAAQPRTTAEIDNLRIHSDYLISICDRSQIEIDRALSVYDPAFKCVLIGYVCAELVRRSEAATDTRERDRLKTAAVFWRSQTVHHVRAGFK